MPSTLLLALVALVAAGATYIYLYIGSRAPNLPPGPPTLPLLGNLHQLPTKGAHFQFTKWAREYGGLYTLKLGTGTAVVITSPRLVKELVDKKGAKYAARPSSYVARLISGGDHILLMEYGAQWRETRKLLHGTFAEKAVEERFLGLQEAEARVMVRGYLLEPEQHMLHPKRFANSVIMSIVWGVRTPTARTGHMHRLYALMEIWSKVMETGATPPVDIYPFLHYLPQRLFLHWRDRATHVRRQMNSLYSAFLRDLRARRAATGSRGAFMDRVLDQAEANADSIRPEALTYSDHELAFLGGTLTEGGSDTSASIITAFVHAMTAHPAVQRKAQAQIDAVIGADRSPQWRDYAALPYVAQCVKETMRWRPVTPLAFPHALAEDDWVDGQFFLPKGTVVIVNAWGLQHDPARFAQPEDFDPEHFAGCTELATELANGSWQKRDHYGYGAGRRFCPGAHLAERNLFLAVAKLLWAFDIVPGKDAEGRVVRPDLDPATGYCEGFLVCARDFPAEFRVRGAERRETILGEVGEAERELFARYAAGGDEVA
ncbi:hypothetical protein LTR08_002234 [Meristemomyces frigidus]|nr:hypothetical protein LTR08_002234 [Meristemomyces frigidus]